jgi:hypothetical protein
MIHVFWGDNNMKMCVRNITIGFVKTAVNCVNHLINQEFILQQCASVDIKRVLRYRVKNVTGQIEQGSIVLGRMVY